MIAVGSTEGGTFYLLGSGEEDERVDVLGGYEE
jgi:hypothetical protein